MMLLEAIPDSDALLELALAGEPLGASAALRPCELYVHTGGSRPSITQGHHVYPIYLQNRKYGRITDGTLKFLCGTCHDNVHAHLYFLMGERREPNPAVPRRARLLAEQAFDWFHDATA